MNLMLLGALLELLSLLKLVVLGNINSSFGKDCGRDPMIECGRKQLNLLVAHQLAAPDVEDLGIFLLANLF